MYCFLYPRTKCIMLNADISFWDWRQYETIAYIISLSWIRFISIKHKSKWMHFELSTHWRSRVLSRPSTSLNIMQDIRDLMNEARFLMKNLLSGCLGTGLFHSSSVADPDLELRRRGGGGGRFFCRLPCWVPPPRSSNDYCIAFNSLWQSPAFLDLCRCSEEKVTLWRKLKNCKNVFS